MAEKDSSSVAKQERLRSHMISLLAVLRDITVVPMDTREDILRMMREFSIMNDPIASAAGHPDLARDIIWTFSRIEALNEKQEFKVDQEWSTALLAAQDHYVSHGMTKPTKDMLEALAKSDEKWQTATQDLIQIKSLRSLFEGLKRALYERAEMIKVLNKKDLDESFNS